MNYHHCVEHFDSVTKKKRTCFIDKLFNDSLQSAFSDYPIRLLLELIDKNEEYMRKHYRIWIEYKKTHAMYEEFTNPVLRKEITSSIEQYFKEFILPFVRFLNELTGILKLITSKTLEKSEYKVLKGGVIKYIENKHKEMINAESRVKLIDEDRKTMSKYEFFSTYVTKVKGDYPFLMKCLYPHIMDKKRQLERKKKLSQKLSEAAFGSENNPGSL